MSLAESDAILKIRNVPVPQTPANTHDRLGLFGASPFEIVAGILNPNLMLIECRVSSVSLSAICDDQERTRAVASPARANLRRRVGMRQLTIVPNSREES